MKNKSIDIVIIIVFTIITFVSLLLFFNGYRFSINISSSLPHKLFLVNTNQKNINNVTNGDFIQFINKDAKYYNGIKITKQVLAKEGDVLEINSFREIKDNIQGTINYGDKVLKVKFKTKKGTEVKINNIKVIPKNRYFVMGYDEHSFDSRYKEFGLIEKSEVIGVAKPLF